MCLRLNINAIKYIAEGNIKVFKVLIYRNGHLEAPVLNYTYTINTLNTLQYPLQLIKSWHKAYIEEGFYSFKYKSDAIDYAFNCFLAITKTCVVECIIPKDSEYYTDGKVIVSNKIIINKILCAQC